MGCKADGEDEYRSNLTVVRISSRRPTKQTAFYAPRLLGRPGVGYDTCHGDHLRVRLGEQPCGLLLPRLGDVRHNRRSDMQGQQRDIRLVEPPVDSGARTVGEDERDDGDA